MTEPLDLSKPAGGKSRPVVRQVGGLAASLPTQVQHTTADVVRLLGAVIARLRLPLLVLCLLPPILGVLLVGVSAVRGGADLTIACVLLVLTAVPSGWLAIRRRQLLGALQPPERAGAEIYAVLSAPLVWSTLKGNLGEIAADRRRVPIRSLGRSIWKGVKLTNDLLGRADDSRLAPFLPGRLRGLVFLTGWCLVAAVVLAGFLLLKILALAVGIG